MVNDWRRTKNYLLLQILGNVADLGRELLRAVGEDGLQSSGVLGVDHLVDLRAQGLQENRRLLGERVEDAHHRWWFIHGHLASDAQLDNLQKKLDL